MSCIVCKKIYFSRALLLLRSCCIALVTLASSGSCVPAGNRPRSRSSSRSRALYEVPLFHTGRGTADITESWVMLRSLALMIVANYSERVSEECACDYCDENKIQKKQSVASIEAKPKKRIPPNTTELCRIYRFLGKCSRPLPVSAVSVSVGQ